MPPSSADSHPSRYASLRAAGVERARRDNALVLLDATFASDHERQLVAAACREARVPCDLVVCSCGEAEATRRVALRGAGADERVQRAFGKSWETVSPEAAAACRRVVLVALDGPDAGAVADSLF